MDGPTSFENDVHPVGVRCRDTVIEQIRRISIKAHRVEVPAEYSNPGVMMHVAALNAGGAGRHDPDAVPAAVGNVACDKLEVELSRILVTTRNFL